MSYSYKLLLSRIFFVCFIVFFSWSLMLVLFWSVYTFIHDKPYFLFPHIYDKPLNPLIIFGGAVCTLLFLIMLNRACSKMDNRLHHILLFVFAGIIPSAQFAFTAIYQVEPKLWDFAVVYHAAREFAQGTNGYSYYFQDYPNNLPITLLISGIYQLFDYLDFHHPHRVGLLFNMFMIDLALLFLYLTARKWFGLKHATMILVLCLLFSPFITYVPIYYTDTISLPMGSGMLYFYTLSLGERSKNRLIFLFLAALFGVLGVLIKPTVGILFAALLIHLFLTERFASFMKQAVLVAAVLFIGLKIYAAWIDSSGILPLPYNQTGYPYTHWMMMGLKGPYGFYDYHDVNYTESFPTKEKRKEANMEVIRTRLHTYGFMGITKLFTTKNLFTWGDGTYFAPVKLDRGAKYTALHSYLLPMKTNQNYVYIYFCQIVNLSLLSLIVLSGWRQLRSRQIGMISVCALSLFGLGLFLLVWEARSRYLINFAPMILLCCLDGLLYVKRP
jgi:hypothetical protein